MHSHAYHQWRRFKARNLWWLRTATVGFFCDRAGEIGKEWSQLDAGAKTTARSDPHYAALMLARDQGRAEYLAVEQKLGDAEMLLSLEKRSQDRNLQILDRATYQSSRILRRGRSVLQGSGAVGHLVPGLAVEHAAAHISRLVWRPPDRASLDAPGGAGK